MIIRLNNWLIPAESLKQVEFLFSDMWRIIKMFVFPADKFRL